MTGCLAAGCILPSVATEVWMDWKVQKENESAAASVILGHGERRTFMYSILNVPLSIEYMYRRQHNSYNDVKNTLVGHSSQILESILQLPI